MAKFTLPKFVLEIEPYFVAGARLAGHGGGLKRLGVQELEEQAIEPAVQRSNLTDAGKLRAALSRIEALVGKQSGSFGLLVPDGAVRVSFLSFETLPDDRRQAEALVRWRMRDNLPGDAQDARLTYQVLSRGKEGVDLLVTAAMTSVLAEYEELRDSGNGGARLLLPATLALLPLLSTKEAGGELLVHVCSGWMTCVVVEGEKLRAWRTRLLDKIAPEALADEITAEAGRVLASARDLRGLQIGRVWLCERPPSIPDLQEALGRGMATEVVRLEPAARLAASLPAPDRLLFERYGAPVAGLLANV